jgi:hypothetical protein
VFASVTLKLAVPPAKTVWLAGPEIEGRNTVSVAALEIAVPALFATTHRNCCPLILELGPVIKSEGVLT